MREIVGLGCTCFCLPKSSQCVDKFTATNVTWKINTVDKRRETSHSEKACPGRPSCKNLHFTWCYECCGSISRQFLPSVTSNTLMRSSAEARTSCTGDRMALSASIRVSFSPLSTWSRVETGPGPDAFIPAIFSPVLPRLTERWWPGTRRKDAQRANARLGRDYETMKCCHSSIIGAFLTIVAPSTGMEVEQLLHRTVFFTLSPPDAQTYALLCANKHILSCTLHTNKDQKDAW